MGVAYRNSQPVAIGIRSYDNVGADPVSEVSSHFQRRRLFGIWRFNRWKIAVGLSLFLHDMNIGKSGELKGPRYHGDRSSVQGCKDDLQFIPVFCVFRRGIVNRSPGKLGVHLFSYDLDQRFIRIKKNVIKSNGIDLLNDFAVLRWHDLPSVAKVNLVSVVFRGIVRGRQNDSRVAAEFANRVRQFWCCPEIFEEIDLDSVGREYLGHRTGKSLAVVPAVIGYGYAGPFVRKILVEII